MFGIDYIALSGLADGFGFQRGLGRPLFANYIPSGLYQVPKRRNLSELDVKFKKQFFPFPNIKREVFTISIFSNTSPKGMQYNSPKGAK